MNISENSGSCISFKINYFDHTLCFQSSDFERLRLENDDKEWPTLSCNPWTYKLKKMCIRSSKRFWLKVDSGCASPALTPQITSEALAAMKVLGKHPPALAESELRLGLCALCKYVTAAQARKSLDLNWYILKIVEKKKRLHFYTRKSKVFTDNVTLTIRSSGAGLSFGCFFMLCVTKQNVHT